MMEKVWIRILGEPSVGVVADGIAVAGGEVIEVTGRTARALFGAGRAILVEPPEAIGGDKTVAEVRRRTR